MHKQWPFFILFFSVILSATAASAGPSDSLMQAYKNAKTSEERAGIAFELGKIYYASNPKLSLKYAQEGLFEAKSLTIPAKVNNANLAGIYHSGHGNYDSAAYFYSIALGTATKLNDKVLINKVQANLGDLYSYKGSYEKALKYQLAVLAFYEKNKDASNVVRTKVNVGNTYNYMHQSDRALSYYQQAYPTLKSQKSRLAANLLNSMGTCYSDLTQYQKAEEFYKQSLEIKRDLNDTLAIVPSLVNLGNLADKRNDKDKARGYFNEALGLAKAIGDKKDEAIILHNLSNMDLKSGNTAKAAKGFEAQYALAKAQGDIRLQRVALAQLHSIYDNARDFEQAYFYLRAYESLADTVSTEVYQKEIAGAETLYKTQRALRARDSLAFAEQLQSNKQKRAVRERNIVLGAGAGGILALSSIFFLLYRNQKNRSKTQENENAAKSLYEGEQNERIRIARDLHDGIGQMLAVVKMQLSMPPELGADRDQNNLATQKLVDNTITELRNISHNLLPEDLSFGLIRALESLCSKLSTNTNIHIELFIHDEIRATKFSQSFSLTLYRIVQEVLGNMIKHSEASQITLNLSPQNEKIILKIADNGKGFDTASIPNTEGIGWKNIGARIKLLNGKLFVQSEQITGTSIEISLPKS